MNMELLNKMEPRQLRLLAVGAILLLTAVLFSYGLLPSIKSNRATLISLQTLQQAVAQGEQIDDQIARLEASIEDLNRELHGDMADLEDNELESFVIGRLQSISWRNNVELVSVEPKPGNTIQNFSESLFDIQLTGDYVNLYNWLIDIKKELGFIVIQEYEMRPTVDVADNPRLAVDLRVASYRVRRS